MPTDHKRHHPADRSEWPIYLLALVLLILFPLAVYGQPQLSGSPDELRGFLFPTPNTVNISGEGELVAYKDVARVSLLVTTEERDLNRAMAENQQIRLSLIDALLAAGIAEDDINNSRFSSSPQFGLFGRSPSSFEVSARLEVSARNEEQLQLLASMADEHDEVEFERTEFEHSEEESSERQVRELAIEDVMEQKAYYEASLGLQLEAINFYYGGVRQMARAMPLAARADFAMAENMAVSSGAAAPSAASTIAPSFDEVRYQTSVTVVFEIVSDP